MNIAFLTTQSSSQSTVIGRVLPLAREFQKMDHVITVFLHKEKGEHSPSYEGGVRGGFTTRITGKNPFARTKDGKKRHGGIRLILTMKINAIRAAWGLIATRPDVIIIVKPLPENTLATCIAKVFLWNTKVILDVDDFELFANNLSSLMQRAAIHVSERIATALASHIVVATPFLYDNMHQMVAGKKSVTLIPTGLSAIAPAKGGATADLTPQNANNHTILYLGSVSVSSGHRVDMLPEILKNVRMQIPDVKLVVAGTGDDDVELKKHFHSIGLDSAVTYFGRFTPEDIPTLLSSCGVLIDPIDASIVSRAKSSFRTALALATGTPLVTSSIGMRTDSIPQTLHQKFFATPGDPISYAKNIVSLMSAPLLAEEKEAMVERSKKYTWENLAKVYSRLFV